MEILNIEYIPAWLDAQLPNAKERLIELVVENSFTQNIEGVNRVQERLATGLKQMGLSVETSSFQQRGVILEAETKAAKDNPKKIVVVGHSDTVHPPEFELHKVTEVDDKLYGPGIYDMKAGLVVIELALAALHSADILDQLPIKVVINSSEEDSTEETRAFMSKCAESARAALVFEFGRSGGNIVTDRKGIFTALVTAEGKAAHAGNNSDRGINAIEELASQLSDLARAIRNTEHETTLNFGKISGGTALNVVAEQAQVEFEVRSATSAGLEAAHDAVRQYVAHSQSDVKLNADISQLVHPLESTDESLKLAKEYIEAGKQAGLNLTILPRVGGLSDANQIAQAGVPVIDGLGPVGDGAHTSEEYIVIRSLYEKALNLIYYLLRQPEVLRDY